MAQKVRRKKKRNTVKGTAIRRNTTQDAVRIVKKTYGNVQVTTYEEKKETDKK